jgi:hypothetical protein
MTRNLNTWDAILGAAELLFSISISSFDGIMAP